jgi:hypothetical protein
MNDLEGMPKEAYGSEYSAHLLEQYKLCVQMADHISSRRQISNAFFLSINTALVAIINLFDPSFCGQIGLIAVCVAGLVMCTAWYSLLKSYRSLNSSKFTVIQAMEKYLPTKPYTAEWTCVGCGKDSKLYWPFTHIETSVPWVFFFLYVILGALLIL